MAFDFRLYIFTNNLTTGALDTQHICVDLRKLIRTLVQSTFYLLRTYIYTREGTGGDTKTGLGYRGRTVLPPPPRSAARFWIADRRTLSDTEATIGRARRKATNDGPTTRHGNERTRLWRLGGKRLDPQVGYTMHILMYILEKNKQTTFSLLD